MKYLNTMKGIVGIFFLVLLLGIPACRNKQIPQEQAGPTPPDWWFNPRQDDEQAMFVKANSVDCATEQEARDKAYSNALASLSKRILSNVSVKGNDIEINSNYALRNTTVFGEKSIKHNGRWYSWALVSYPQKEKSRLLIRLEKSTKNIQDIRSRVKKISNDFKIKFETLNRKTNFREGESVAFKLTSPRDCHVAVFCHQADGTTVLLFPNSWNGNTKVYANKPVDVPGATKSDFEIVVGPPYGTDIIQVIACTEPSLLHKRLRHMAGQREGYRGISRGLFSRGINDSLSAFDKSGNPPSWGETTISISTYPK